MKNIAVLVDANVILDYITTREPYYHDVYKAIDMDNFRNFEDCLQDRCAESVNAQYIITNKIKDFRESVITAITPYDFCKWMNQ